MSQSKGPATEFLWNWGFLVYLFAFALKNDAFSNLFMLFIYWMIVDIDELNQIFLSLDNFYFKHPNPQFEGNSVAGPLIHH